MLSDGSVQYLSCARPIAFRRPGQDSHLRIGRGQSFSVLPLVKSLVRFRWEPIERPHVVLSSDAPPGRVPPFALWALPDSGTRLSVSGAAPGLRVACLGCA